MSWQVAVELVHVLGALGFGAGYIAANVLLEIARVTDDPPLRRIAVGLAGWFDRFLLVPFAVLAGISGIFLAVLLRYPVTAQWIWLSLLLSGGAVVLALAIWRRRSVAVDEALAADDDAAAAALLRDMRFVALRRGENVAVFILVVLMVVRPT